MSDFVGLIKKNHCTEISLGKKNCFKHFRDGNYSVSYNENFDIVSHETENYFALVYGSILKSCEDSTTPEALYIETLVEEFTRIDLSKGLHPVHGHFAMCIYVKGKEEVILINDNIASHPIYYTSTEDFLLFSSNIQLIKDNEISNFTLNSEALFDFMSLKVSNLKNTFYQEIYRLEPKSRLTSSFSKITLETYEIKKSHAPIKKNQALSNYSKTFESSVNRCVEKQTRIGLMLSGGLDSSSIAVALKKIKVNAVKTFSGNWLRPLNSKILASDESAYQKIVSNHTKFQHLRVPLDEISPVSSIKKHVDIFGTPHHFNNIYLFDQIAVSAKTNNVNLILDGNDGDTTVSHGLERFWELAKNFNPIGLIYELLRYSIFNEKSFFKIARFFASQILIKRGLKDPVTTNTSLIKDTLFDAKLSKLPRNKTAVDSHLEKLSNPLHTIAFEMKYLLFKYYKIEVRSPFYDVSLINFCLSLPSFWKLRHGKTRYILRSYLNHNGLGSIGNRKSKALLTGGLINTISPRDVESITQEIENIHPEIESIIDRKKLEKCLDKLRAKDNVSDRDITNLLTFYTANIWLNKNFPMKYTCTAASLHHK